MGESGIKRQAWSIGQLIKSEDINGVSDLLGRALIESLWAQNFGDVYKGNKNGIGGVLGGFTVAVNPGNYTVVIEPGLALIPEVPADSATDSRMVLIQTDEVHQIDLTALIDATFPRLVTIEIAADLGVVFSTKVRPKIDPTTGVYTPTPFDVVIGGSPTYFATAGTASAAPVVAAGTPGRIPLAVVKLPSGLPGYTDAYSPVLMCRPMLRAMGSTQVPRDYVRGGGVSVGEESGGVIVNTTALYLSKLSCSLAGVEAEVSGSLFFDLYGRTPDTTSIAVLLGTPMPVYGYAATPPWANDYGDIAPREAWQRNPNAVAFVDDYNVIGGQGTTFTSLSAETTASQGKSYRNAIVIWDSVAPSGLERGAGNAPLQVIDARGPHPTTAGGAAITLDATQDPTWGATQEVLDTVYLGAASALGVVAGGANDFMAQAYEDGHVVALDAVDFAGSLASTRRPAVTFNTTATEAIYPGRFPSMVVGDDEVIPTAAEEIDVYYRFVAGNGPGDAQFSLFPDVGFGRPEVALVPLSGVTEKIDTATASDYESAASVTLKRSAADSINKILVIGVGTSLLVILAGYRDALLSAR